MEAMLREERSLRRRFSRVTTGMSERQVRRTMGRAPDWQHGGRWGYVFVYHVQGAPMRSHPSLVVEFDGGTVSDTCEKPPAPEFVKAIREDARPARPTGRSRPD
jgi:hypothetical protein